MGFKIYQNGVIRDASPEEIEQLANLTPPEETTLMKSRGKTVEQLEKENAELREQLGKLTAKK